MSDSPFFLHSEKLQMHPDELEHDSFPVTVASEFSHDTSLSGFNWIIWNSQKSHCRAGLKSILLRPGIKALPLSHTLTVKQMTALRFCRVQPELRLDFLRVNIPSHTLSSSHGTSVTLTGFLRTKIKSQVAGDWRDQRTSSLRNPPPQSDKRRLVLGDDNKRHRPIIVSPQ
ncbi:hypothetical protein H6P81_021102 [Aristolochia fimbriata]|uniref:Uncharacterized protein n=1 Tax=Aristolochia fimbriata TaxID=158543 RepID=A0AAV7E0M0_ARIFI|nr:hypothetical protein H6P81_021102 [Aristolochia fimbriata]